MTRDQKDILIKDLHARLPYDTCVYVAVNTVNGLEWNWEKLTKQLLIQIEEEDAWEYIKPLLRPMSSMTEEEKKEFIKVSDYVVEESVNGRHYEFFLSDYVGKPNEPTANFNAIDWLNKNKFDYRGLIPMDLAIAVTEENNSYKTKKLKYNDIF